jgi:type IV fimbrial biogenesis protein FimT
MNKPHTPTFRSAKQHGITLAEMLVALAVLAILIPIGVPQLTGVANSMKLTSASNMLLSHFHLARSEAIKRNNRVVLCKSSNGASCAASGGWEQGWIIFVDANNNGVHEETEAVVLREQPLTGRLRLTGNQTVARYVSFAPNGATKLTGGSFQAGTLTVCNESQEPSEARQIIINAVGRPRVQRTSVASCG